MGVFMGYIKLSKMEELVWGVETHRGTREDDSKYLIKSQVSKTKEIDFVLNKIDFGYHKNFIVFGLKNIDLLVEIYKRKTPFSTVTIIEITKDGEQEFCFEGEENQLALLKDPKVSLIIGSENELGRQLDIALKDMLKIYNIRNTEIISMPYVKSTYPREFESVLSTIFQKIQTALHSFGNDVEDILIGMDNYINNWKYVFKGLDCKHFENEYKGKPAIIVGAGPSLDKNIDFLGRAKDKALIFSVDGAMNTLLNKDIIPDVVSSIERVNLTAKFYENKDIPQDIIYVGPNVVMGSILERFSRIIFTGRYGDGFFRDLNQSIGFSNLEIGLNVSTVLIAFARYLGCYPIIFMGLDLAYTNGRTHTEKFADNFDESFMNNYKKNLVYVKGQNGEMLESFEHFMHTKSYIESMIASDKEGLFINATEGGANIEGAINLKLTDAIENYCTDKEIVRLKSIYNKVKKEETVDKDSITMRAIKFLEDLKEYLEILCRRSEENYNELLGSKKAGRVLLMEKQRRLFEDILDENVAGRFVIQPVIINFNRDIHSFPMRLERQDEDRMFERTLRHYKTLQDVINKINESIDLYIKVLKSHINENNIGIGD